MATGVPLVLFTMIGQTSFGSMASMGALTVLYGARLRTNERLRILPLIGLGLMISSALAILCAGNEWLSFTSLLLVTTISGILILGTGIGPPGSVMFVLVTAISSQFAISANPTVAGFESYVIPLLVGAGALIAWLVIALLSFIPLFRHEPPANDNFPGLHKLKPDRETIFITSRVVIGVLAAMLLSKPLGIHRVYWVFVAVTAILQTSYDKQLTSIRAVERVLGTVLGVVAFEALNLLEPSGIWILLIIVLCQFATQVVIARNYMLGLIFITPMALTLATIGHRADTFITAKERVVDTLVGAGIAIVVFWVEELVILGWRKSRK